MASRGNRGFTLIELLTVVSIIGVLAALLLPTLSFAKFQARNTACRSNLRQMQLAMELYATTFDAYPPVWSPVEGQTDSRYRWDMLLVHLAAPTRYVVPFSATKGTVAPARSFLCPLLIGPLQNLMNPSGPAWDSAYRYNSSGVAHAFNPLGLGGTEIAFPLFSATKQSALIAPSDMVSLGDPLSRSADPRWDGSYDPTTLELRPQPAGLQLSGLDARTMTVYRKHRNRYNRVYCDGHLELEDCNKPFAVSDSYLARWNIDHEAHRELWVP
jgi:prepilin-type N-terminal cleavage/methylation domain-containing protein